MNFDESNQKTSSSSSPSLNERIISEISVPLPLISERINCLLDERSFSKTKWVSVKNKFEEVRDFIGSLRGSSEVLKSKYREDILDLAHTINNCLAVCFISIDRICRTEKGSHASWVKDAEKINDTVAKIQEILKGSLPIFGTACLAGEGVQQ